MPRIISVFADDLSLFQDFNESPVNGGVMCAAALLRRFIEEPTVQALEVFLPPALMVRTEDLTLAARRFLPPGRRGVGALRFYALHTLPEVWSDGAPRLLYCPDVELLSRHRYLRDRYAVAPCPIMADTHTLSHQPFWTALRPLASAPHVPFDSIVCHAPSSEETLKRGFAWLASLDHGGDGLPCRLDALPHGLDTETFSPPAETLSQATGEVSDSAVRARRALGLPLTGQIAMYFGRITPYSKADLLPLLDAFSRATASPGDYLVLVGQEFPPGYADKLREAGDQLGLGERLIVTGRAEPAFRSLYFAAADLFVFPGESTVETFGNTVIEAMASGLPVIVSDWDGLRHHVREGETGRLVPTYWMPALERIEAFSPVSTRWSAQLLLAQSTWVDVEVLADALRELLGDAALRRRMGAAGRRMAEEAYAWPRVMALWRDLWAALERGASEESPEAAQARRAGALRIGAPVPYLHLFEHYATGVFDLQRYGVTLCAQGRRVAAGEAEVKFYDETLALIRDEVLRAILATLSDTQHYVQLEGLIRTIAEVTSADLDVVRFHVALLLKRGLLDIAQLSDP
jgi:glycosyltransferase involved in cell wall biosynthesis